MDKMIKRFIALEINEAWVVFILVTTNNDFSLTICEN